MRQVDCYLSTTWGRLLVSISYMKQYDVICQLPEAFDSYLSFTWGMLSVSVSYMRQDDGYLSVT
jgi:hypothetical protein